MSLDHRIVMPPAEEFQGLSPEELPKGLEGLVVVELGDYVAMPACTRALGEMGATVYKIETIKGNLHRGDGVGFGMPELGPDNPAFDMSNANKKFLSIDMKSDGGRELVEKLLEQADVFVTSLRNPSLRRLGYDYETLHARYPRLVYGQMRGYGERGAMKDAKGFDATCYSARGGLLMSIPQAGEHFQPGNMPAAFGDFNSCIALGLGIMSAVWRAQRTGMGDHVTVNLHHMALWGMQVPVVSAPFGVPFPKSRKAVPCPTNNSYMTADGVWFLICYGTYDSWYPFVARLIGLEEYADDPRFTNCATINANGDNATVVNMMAEAFAKHDWAYWKEVFDTNDVPYAVCNTMDDVLEDEEAYVNDMLRPIHYDSIGDHSITTIPIRMKSQGDPVISRAKPVGYDTRAVMEDLGYSEAEVDALVEAGNVRCYDEEAPAKLDDRPLRIPPLSLVADGSKSESVLTDDAVYPLVTTLFGDVGTGVQALAVTHRHEQLSDQVLEEIRIFSHDDRNEVVGERVANLAVGRLHRLLRGLLVLQRRNALGL